MKMMNGMDLPLLLLTILRVTHTDAAFVFNSGFHTTRTVHDTTQRRFYRSTSLYESNRGSAVTNTILSPGNNPSSISKRAGEDGYSINRQPLSWDSESGPADPTFAAPSILDETKDNPQQVDSDWFLQRSLLSSRSSTSSSLNPSLYYSLSGDDVKNDTDIQNRNDEFELSSQNLDLFQRTMDTLDYPIILKALLKECDTVPGKYIIEKSLYRNDKDFKEKEKLRNKRRDASKQPKQNKNKNDGENNVDPDNNIMTMELTANTVDGVLRRYQAIKEMKYILAGNVEITKSISSEQNQNTKYNGGDKALKRKSKPKKLDSPPLSKSSFDLQPLFDKVDMGGVLDGPDILEMSSILDACVDVSDWCLTLDQYAKSKTRSSMDQQDTSANQDSINFVEIPKIGKSIFIDDELLDLLSNAFDQDGKLSGSTFPGIGRLRAKVRTLKGDILTTLNTLMDTPSIKSKVSLESGGALYSEVNGRIVIPIADKYKNSVGIIHDVSRSGKTAYVEPTEIVSVSNEMRTAEMELRKEEARIWRLLTSKIIEQREDIERSVAVVAQIDLIIARIRLGDRLAGVIPEVRNEGVVSLKCAKHPVLLLREIKNVVGSDVDLGGGKNQGLVLTGPNSGGKTIILKLLGLCALMVRDGIPVPAQPDGARVDFFGPVLADIGDMQSVDGDLSTFSGHMLVCREVLANSGKNALVLMDELGSGTDPNQGTAIAQALLEALMEKGARVAITTHYLALKQLAASDDRFSVGGMQFVNGRPTYKLLPGVVGESFALSVAERLQLPSSVISRATELLDTETRQMGDLLREMEDQKAVIDDQAKELSNKMSKLAQLEEDLKKRQEKLDRELIKVRTQEAKKFAQKLEEKEKILEDILEKLKADPSKKVLARSWDEIQYTKRDAMIEAENIPSVLRKKRQAAADAVEEAAELVPLSTMREKPQLNAGDKLIVCKVGPLLGSEAEVISSSTKKIDVKVRGMAMSMKLNELALVPKGRQPKTDVSNEDNSRDQSMSKMARKALLAEEDAMPSKNVYKDNVNSSSSNESGSMMRLQSNTIDVLGCNFEEARRKCEDKFSSVMTNKNAVVFILHGHGTQGVLKQKIRDWLRREKSLVKAWRPADASDGGDAFTMVEVKKII